jgi:hypothetical protein
MGVNRAGRSAALRNHRFAEIFRCDQDDRNERLGMTLLACRNDGVAAKKHPGSLDFARNALRSG